ncbi:MAG: Ig-like domain-containing protein [Candidatus Eiseniibacteriota bacterium]
MTRSDRLRGSAGRESLLSASLVIACFAFFLGVVNFTFPEGLSLRSYIRAADGSAADAQSALRQLDLSAIPGAGGEIATLERIVRKVKDKPHEAIAWQDAKQGLTLGAMHSVQTLAGSEATITFGSAGSLVLGENSLIVLKSVEGESDGGHRRVTIAVFGGELRGTLGGSPGEPMRMVVETPAGRTRIEAASDGSAPPPTFRVEVREDQGATFTVFEGTARVTAGNRTVDVGASQGVSIGPDGSLEAPRALLPAPALHEPGEGFRIVEKSRPAWVEFRWAEVEGATSYRLILEPGVGSGAVRIDRIVDETFANVGMNEGGAWRWSVASRRGPVEGEPSAARQLDLVLDGESPPLEVAWPDFVVRERKLLLTGSTEAGATVSVGSQEAEVDDSGRFEVSLDLSRGGNKVVVEAVDGAGNRTYRSRVVKALF